MGNTDLNTKSITNLQITAKEEKMLKYIKSQQNEQGHSDFISTDVKCKSNAGIVSSLFKKGLIYDSYDSLNDEDFEERRYKMWCLTEEAIKIVGKPKSWW